MTTLATTAPARPHHRPAGTGPALWGPGDHYTFLVTGEETGGAYFVMDARVGPGGGPPPHTHRDEDETFLILEGRFAFVLGDERFVAGPGDFVSVPRGVVHGWQNCGEDVARLIITFTPAGLERFFLETLEPAPNQVTGMPDNIDEVVARYVEASPRHGITFV